MSAAADEVTLTIDGRPVTVARGTTVLQAAGRLGVRIPSLCSVAGLAPSASCFVCCVQVEGSRTLSPSCALPAADGMVVTTTSDDIRGARKMAMELLLSDHAGDCIAPCAASCPAGLDVAGYVYHLAGGDNDQAMAVIYQRLALPGSLGRVCPRLCEESCRRCEQDGDGLAIAALHRYATDRNDRSAEPHLPARRAPSGKRVAIVGAGPAGLSAAFYLGLDGHECTLFDAHPEPGGMLRWGIPAYRLPRAALEQEIRAVTKLGARFRPGQRWGRDFRLEDLRRDHDAVFLAIGAQRSRSLGCEGEELALDGIELLRRVASDESPALGRRVIVIGGGNTAMDAARSALRLGADVRVFYRRTRDEMPCLLEEVTQAEEEGVEVELLLAPLRLRRLESGAGLRLTVQRMQLGEPDRSGRRRPVPIPGTELEVDADAVIAAIGQAVERELAQSEGLEVTSWGLAADPKTLATNLDGVFAGGDAVLGADLAVRAVAAGRIAARSIGQYLAGAAVTGPDELTHIALRPIDDEERAELLRGVERSARVPTPTLPLERRRQSFDEVDLGLDDAHAPLEAVRCMTCGCRKACDCSLRRLATEYGAEPYRFTGRRRRFVQDDSHREIVLEPGKCILCDACVRIAAEAGEDLGLTIHGRGFDVSVAVPFDRSAAEALEHAAHRAATACPTGAIALRTERSCDLAGSCPELAAERLTTIRPARPRQE